MDIGIIGGADGPTQILVSASPDWPLWALAFLAAAAVLLLVLRKRRKK